MNTHDSKVVNSETAQDTDTAPTKKIRKKYKPRAKKPIDPEIQKQKYLERRRKNNIASRGSRAKTKQRFEAALAENERLSTLNAALVKENEELKRKLQLFIKQQV